MKHGSPAADSVVPNEFPLFASSWVALYVILRDSLGKPDAPRPANTPADSKPGTERHVP